MWTPGPVRALACENPAGPDFALLLLWRVGIKGGWDGRDAGAQAVEVGKVSTDRWGVSACS